MLVAVYSFPGFDEAGMVNVVVYGKVDLMIDCIIAQPAKSMVKAIEKINGFFIITRKFRV